MRVNFVGHLFLLVCKTGTEGTSIFELKTKFCSLVIELLLRSFKRRFALVSSEFMKHSWIKIRSTNETFDRGFSPASTPGKRSVDWAQTYKLESRYVRTPFVNMARSLPIDVCHVSGRISFVHVSFCCFLQKADYPLIGNLWESPLLSTQAYSQCQSFNNLPSFKIQEPRLLKDSKFLSCVPVQISGGRAPRAREFRFIHKSRARGIDFSCFLENYFGVFGNQILANATRQFGNKISII